MVELGDGLQQMQWKEGQQNLETAGLEAEEDTICKQACFESITQICNAL